MPENSVPWAHDRKYVLEALEDIKKALQALDHSIHGNGDPGLKGEVAALKTERDNRQWRNRMVVGALVTAVVVSTVANVFAAAKLYAVGKSEQVQQGR